MPYYCEVNNRTAPTTSAIRSNAINSPTAAGIRTTSAAGAGRRLVNFPHTDNRQDYGTYGGHQRSQYRDPAHELRNVRVGNHPERGLETGISGLDDQGDQQVQHAGAYKQRYHGDDRRKEHRGYYSNS